MAEPLCAVLAFREFGFRLCQEVVDVNRSSLDDCSTTNRAAAKGLLKTKPRLNGTVVSCQPQYISLDESNHRIV
jgi:hypothetical protein